MAEQLANLGYLALKKQTTKDVAVIPNVFIPIHSESLATSLNLDDSTPAMGHRFARHAVRQGLRGHSGSFTVFAEPNTAGYLFDMLLKAGAPTGVGPYTRQYTADLSSAYTIDILKGEHVFRFIGVEASRIAPSFEANEMRLEVSVSALRSFTTREIASVTGTGPYTITLKTDYDPKPTTGLVVGDLIQIYDVSVNSYIDCEVDALTGTTITVSEDVSAGAVGDILSIRAQTPSFALRSPFLWSATQFHFGADATAALAAAQTRLEEGSTWAIAHNFEDEQGAKRSGALDPAALVRTTADAEFTARSFFDTPADLNRFESVAKRACVIRHFSEGNTYELRVTLNNLRARDGGHPALETGNILYQELNFAPTYDEADGQAFDVKVINNVAAI